MLKAKMSDDAFLLGITNENIKHLKRDEPMFINLKDLKGPDIKVFIVWGEYESSINRETQEIRVNIR